MTEIVFWPQAREDKFKGVSTGFAVAMVTYYAFNIAIIGSPVAVHFCDTNVVALIGHVRYINILTWLRCFQVKLLYLVLFSLYPSLFWELRDKRNLKNLQFWPESLGAMLEFWYIERDIDPPMYSCWKSARSELFFFAPLTASNMISISIIRISPLVGFRYTL